VATWEDFIVAAQFDGLTIDVVSTRDEGANDIDSQKFPNKNGTKRVYRGANGWQRDIVAVFMESDYPDTMDQLIKKLEEQKIHEFIHPIFGKKKVACDRFVVAHDAEDAADFGTVQMTLLEHTDGEGVTVQRDPIPARANQVRTLGTEILEALSELQATLEIQNSEIGLAVIGAVNAANSVAESLEATGDDLSSIAVQATTSGAVAKVDEAITLVADYSSSEEYELSRLLCDLAGALSAMAGSLIEKRPPLQKFSVVAETNLRAWVFDKYCKLGLSVEELEDRVNEVLSLNSFPDPMTIPAGFSVIAYDE